MILIEITCQTEVDKSFKLRADMEQQKKNEAKMEQLEQPLEEAESTHEAAEEDTYFFQ